MHRIFIIMISIILILQPNLMGKEKTVVAIAADGDTLEASVSGMAGRCSYFLIVDSNRKLIKALENPYKDKGQAGISAADFLASKDVTIVIGGHFGDKMRDVLDANKIAYVEFAGTAKEAIDKILEKDKRR
jgi:predicted Fe-Mo cluster-binding NifX family protein